MDASVNEITINGVQYVPKSGTIEAEKLDGMVYSIIRTYTAGVFAGYVKRKHEKEVEIVNARRLWYWSGAASLSQLAIKGTNKPNDCKFAMVLPVVIVTEAIEIIPCSEQSKKSIEGVKIWKV